VKHHVVSVDVSIERLEIADGAFHLKLSVVVVSRLFVVVHDFVVVVNVVVGIFQIIVMSAEASGSKIWE
jgi:preprotein translocase subunit SecB